MAFFDQLLSPPTVDALSEQQTVFLSETTPDLTAIRSVPVEVLKDISTAIGTLQILDGSASTNGSSPIAAIGSSDIVIVIVGHQYGVPDASGISLTEQQYLEGLRRGKRIQIYLRAEDAPIPPGEFEPNID